MKTLEISRGNQYDRNGYYLGVIGTGLYAFGRIAKRMDGTVGVTYDGTWSPDRNDRPTVDAAIRKVIETGEPCTLTIGAPEPVKPAAPTVPEWRSPRGLTLTEEMDREDTVY